MMGREVKRVPTNFDWPMGKTWFGFLLDSIPCDLCNGTGNASKKGKGGYQLEGVLHFSDYESDYCPICGGEGRAFPKIEIPIGPGYQMWETTSEGSAMSPVFDTPEELARWLGDNNASAFGGQGATYEHWLGMITSGGYAMSMVVSDGKIQSGVEFMATSKKEADNATSKKKK